MHIGRTSRRETRYALDTAVGTRVWDILIKECGAQATGSTPEQFFHHIGRVERDGLEFRFMGTLGFGGKVYLEPRAAYRPCFRVTCYREDETPKRLDMLNRANSLFTELAAEVAPTCWREVSVDA